MLAILEIFRITIRKTQLVPLTSFTIKINLMNVWLIYFPLIRNITMELIFAYFGLKQNAIKTL